MDMWRRVFHSTIVLRLGETHARLVSASYARTMTGAGVPASRLNEVCRILRRRDRPTAHPRHGSMQARLEVQTARYQRTVAEVTKLPSRSLSISLLPCDTGLCDCGDHASGDTLRRSKAPDLPLIPSMLSFGRAGCSISRRYSVPDAIP